ncbi:hypothetical protein WDU94_000344 [Cyamophila willieti]
MTSLYTLKSARRQESTIDKLFHNKHPLIESVNLREHVNNNINIKSVIMTDPDSNGDNGFVTDIASDATTLDNSLEKPVTVNHVTATEANNVSTRPATDHSKQTDSNKGLNQVQDTDLIYTSEPNGATRVILNESGVGAQPPVSVPGLLSRIVANYPDQVAICQKKEDEEWKKITYKEYETNVRTVAKAFIKLGLERYHSVCIIGFNSPEWFYSDLGAIYAGGFAAGMYTTNSPEACLHCLVSSDANICVVEDGKQLEKILQIKSQCPKLKAIIQYEGKPDKPGVMSWEELLALGQSQSDDALNSVLETIATNECCTLVYTSGTEGASKPVMLSHDNITFNAAAIVDYIKLTAGSDLSVISFLPLSHIAAQIVDIYSVITLAATVWFADKDALKGSLIKTLTEVRPHVFLAVPRVWEKVHEKLMAVGKQTTGVKRWIANYAKSTSLQHYMATLEKNVSEPYTYRLVRWLILSKVKQAMGLDRCIVALSGAAPISVDLKRYFLSLDIPICEVFGMSECAGAHTLSKPDDFKLEGVGRTMPGTFTKIVDPDEEGNGEICLKGRHVFMGYLRLQDKTENTIDKEGWLHSGDVGKVDPEGFVQITGRIKELIITAGGENVAPVPIEHMVKFELPVISNAFLVGDKKKFLSLLVSLRTKMNINTGEPQDELEVDTKDWLKSLGVEGVETLKELLEQKPEAVYKALQTGIDRVNTKSISNAQKIQKFEILPADFSLPTGELGPTMKVKRPVVVKKYQSIIDKFYDV